MPEAAAIMDPTSVGMGEEDAGLVSAFFFLNVKSQLPSDRQGMMRAF